ncbi:hypothetical protein [Cohnella sp. JJ-181]|uniref:hypothetical protein n=1 Tax=Cohnella rhizoplanae TaxID=2974897 RepID=UPI0022FF97B6|nr:hypothetical protein [Cohnella sp. JJ-181]CAI6038990.1 hypothetical protein COHCIP112018_01006 [Cohnella sp. JJ-181]
MNKPLGLLFAVVSMLLLLGTAIAIDYNGWLASGLAVLSLAFIGWGFALKSKIARRREIQQR